LLQRPWFVTTHPDRTPERNSFKPRKTPEQVLSKIPVSFQALLGLNKRDGVAKERAAVEKCFSPMVVL